MCRNIRPLNNFQPPATDDEVSAAALQYVRKVSGMTKPSQANKEVFDKAVQDIAHIARSRAFAASTSRSFGGAAVTRSSIRCRVM